MPTYNPLDESFYHKPEASSAINKSQYSAPPLLAEDSGWASEPANTAPGIVNQAIPMWDSDFVACINPSLIIESAIYRYGSSLDLEGLRGTRGHGKGSQSTTAAEEVPVMGTGERRRAPDLAPYTPYKQLPRKGVVFMLKDDGSGPKFGESHQLLFSAAINMARDTRGYALPDAALAFLGTPARTTLMTRCFDRVFFPPEDKHEKDTTRGHICRVKMQIERDENGRLVWLPIEKKCEPHKTGDHYRVHLLRVHLATRVGRYSGDTSRKNQEERDE